MKTKYYADLHCHSTASDGSDAPGRVAERAAEIGLKAMALTDHDTVAGVAEAQSVGASRGVQVIPGVELTCYVGKREVHMLGYGIDINNADLLRHCEAFQKARVERARLIGKRLEECGVPIDMNKVMAVADGGVVGRPHVANALVEAGHVKDFQEAFDLYLANGKPACVNKMAITPEECIDVIRKAGGIGVMAHPALGEHFDLIPRLIGLGVSGVEVFHSAHDAATTEKLNVMALENGWLKTGGSDCHGSVKGGEPILGGWGLDEPQFKKFLAALEEAGAATG